MAIQKRQTEGGKARYLVRVNVTDPITGNRKWRNVGTFSTKKEAEKVERDALTQRDRGTLVDPSKATVSEVLADWLRSKAGQVSANSLHDYETIIRLHIVPVLGTVKAQDLTPARIQRQYDDWKDAGLSPRMIRGAHMRLSQAFDRAEKLGIMSRNPCGTVEPPRLERATVSTWTEDEARRFLTTAQARPVLNRAGDTGRCEQDPLHPLWHLLLLEGMRRGEGLGLRWRDVNINAGTASITQTVAPNKSAKGAPMILPRAKTAAGARMVRLTPQTINALREHKKAQIARRLGAPEWEDNDLIVCTSRGTPVNPNNVSRSFVAIVRAATMPDGSKLRNIRLHDLRHTSATMMLRAGIPAKVVSERLGHATIGITMDLYSHVTEDMQKDAATRIGEIFRLSLTGTKG